MCRKAKRWGRILRGGTIAGTLLIGLLYVFVLSGLMADWIAMPWKHIWADILLVDWACLFLLALIMAMVFEKPNLLQSVLTTVQCILMRH